MDDQDFGQLGAATLARKIRTREVSSVEVMQAFQARVEAANPALNAVVTPNEAALEQARQADEALSRGQVRGPLHGVPFTVKDAYDTAGVRSTCGSLLWADVVPQADATIVSRLKAAGAILLGKTNLPEFCLGVETDNRIFGRTVNPWDTRRTPGGSSGGEAAAIASGMSPLGVGSDQGGSLRLPAHYCGIVGFKPTLGRIPSTGHRPDTLHRFATAGLMGRQVADVRLGLHVTAGADGSDWYAQVPPPANAAVSVGQLKVGVVSGEAFGSLEPDIAQAVRDAGQRLKDCVGSVTELTELAPLDVDCDLLSEGLYRAEGERFLAQVIAGREDLLHPWIANELGRATRTLPDYLEAAARVEHFRQQMLARFEPFDLLLCPVGPIVAPVCGSDHIVVNGERRRLRSVNRALQPFNLSGNPAISVPYTHQAETGLPIGVQIVGRLFCEETVLALAERLEMIRPIGYRPAMPLVVSGT